MGELGDLGDLAIWRGWPKSCELDVVRLGCWSVGLLVCWSVGVLGGLALGELGELVAGDPFFDAFFVTFLSKDREG